MAVDADRVSAAAVILVVIGRKEIDVPALFHELSILQKGENGTYSKIRCFLGDPRVSIRDYQQYVKDSPWGPDAGARPYVRERHEGLREAKHEDCLEVVTPPVRDLKSSGCTVCVVFTSALVERIALSLFEICLRARVMREGVTYT